MKVAIYVRVSSQEQAIHGYSVEEQQKKLKAYVNLKDWTIYETYIDPGFTGSNIKRPGVQKLISDAKNKKFDIVLVYKLDRLSRSQKDTMYLLEDIFLPNGVDLIAINESFDTSTPFGRAMIGILSVFAQLERENIKERTVMGRIARANKGYYHGSHAPIGYQFKPGTTDLIVDPYEARIVKDIFDKAITGSSTSEIRSYIIDKYGKGSYEWDNRFIRGILRNSNYIGNIKYSNKIYKGIHDPIISEEDFNTVQGILDRRKEIYYKKRQPSDQSIHLLTGLLFCGDCGARMSYAKINDNIDRYVCYSVSHKSKSLIRSKNCTNRLHPLSAKELEDLIIGEIIKLTLDPNALEDIRVITAPEDNTIEIVDRIVKVDKQISRLLDLYKIGLTDIDEISIKLENLRDEKEKLEKLLESDNIKTTITLDEARDSLLTFEEILENGSRAELSDIIHFLIDKIEMLNDDIKIYWSFC